MEAGASICTCTVCVLDAVPLLVGLRDRCCEMAPVAGLAPARTRLKGEALGSLHSRAFDEMAERGGHAPHHAKCATISLAKSPGSLVRFTFHWCPWQDSHLQPFRLERNASSLGYTRVFAHGHLVPTVGIAPTLDAF